MAALHHNVHMVSLFMKCYIRMLWLSKVQRCKPLFTSMSVQLGSAFVAWLRAGHAHVPAPGLLVVAESLIESGCNGGDRKLGHSPCAQHEAAQVGLQGRQRGATKSIGRMRD